MTFLPSSSPRPPANSGGGGLELPQAPDARRGGTATDLCAQSEKQFFLIFKCDAVFYCFIQDIFFRPQFKETEKSRVFFIFF